MLARFPSDINEKNKVDVRKFQESHTAYALSKGFV